ncbi:hypothetical protein DFQ26_006954 [Actinomortierella ambigua]|nr:hypothetical protein DFQ26_006954 [Actinomortierella ambigua]
MIDIDVVHHLLQLCPNIRRLELDHYRKDTYTLEYCNPRLEALAVTGGFDQQLTQSVTMRFRGLRSLTFGKIDGKDSIPLMIEMIQGLPSLDKIGLSGFSPKLVDEDYAKLIAAGLKGWQQVELAHVGQTTIAAVAKHCRTLEFLSIRCISGFDSRQLVDLLASSPRLRTFRMLTNTFDAKSFVDPEPATTTTMTTTTARTLRPWLCEATLTEFRAHIGDIPRPDLTFDLQDDLHGNTADKQDRHDEDADDTDDDGDDEWCAPRLREAYPGESIHLQQQVLARLGRLRQLRRLQLGLEDLDAAERDAIKYSANYQAPFHDWHYQDECLDMTLASGLGQLLSLRQLRYLNIGRMASRVGPEEVEWMVQHWPQLETLEGLCADEEEEAAWQLWAIAPHINTIRFHRIT